jgi:putative ABC transport system permease protein
MLALLRLVSLRHLVRAPLRSLLTLTGVAVGVATLVGVLAINRSVSAAFRSTVETVAGGADLVVSLGGAGFDQAVLEQVRQVEGVEHAAAALTAVLPVPGAPGQSLMILATDLLDGTYFRREGGIDPKVSAMGDDLEFLNSTDRLLVTERFAREHRLKVGDAFVLTTPVGAQTFYVHALLKETGALKAFGGWVAVMDLAAAQVALGRGEHVDRIDVAVKDKAQAGEVAARLRAALGGGFEVEAPSRRGASVEKMVLSFQMGLNLGSGVALLVGIFLVYNTIAIGVVQRRRELGTLRALGATRRGVSLLFTLEAVVFGVAGSAVGVPLGIGLGKVALSFVSRSISELYVQVNARDLELGALEVLLGVGLGLVGSAFAAFRPASAAARVEPVEALRRDAMAAVSRDGRERMPFFAALGLFAFSALATQLPPPIENFPLGGYLAVFGMLLGSTLLAPWLIRRLGPVFARLGGWVAGVSGRLAADNFSRVPGRSAVPVAALALGVAMTLSIAGFVGSFQRASDTWIRQSIPADLFFTSSARFGGVQNVALKPDPPKSWPRFRACARSTWCGSSRTMPSAFACSSSRFARRSTSAGACRCCSTGSLRTPPSARKGGSASPTTWPGAATCVWATASRCRRRRAAARTGCRRFFAITPRTRERSSWTGIRSSSTSPTTASTPSSCTWKTRAASTRFDAR